MTKKTKDALADEVAELYQLSLMRETIDQRLARMSVALDNFGVMLGRMSTRLDRIVEIYERLLVLKLGDHKSGREKREAGAGKVNPRIRNLNPKRHKNK
jgi:hypothetical protein